MKISPGVSDLWMVENRPLPLTRPMAYTTACTTVQAMMRQNDSTKIVHILSLNKPPESALSRLKKYHTQKSQYIKKLNSKTGKHLLYLLFGTVWQLNHLLFIRNRMTTTCEASQVIHLVLNSSVLPFRHVA